MAENIELNAGERYAGVILGASAAPSHHLILLPGVLPPSTWAAATAWANQAGGTLPDRREQSLLFANLRDAFEYAGYWSGELSGHHDRVWAQIFRLGGQYCENVDNALHAVTVRRIPVRADHEPHPVDHVREVAEMVSSAAAKPVMTDVILQWRTKLSHQWLDIDPRHADEYGKYPTACDYRTLYAAPQQPAPAIGANARDAERYRWLREQQWNASNLFVVAGSHLRIHLGTDCPNLGRLDEAIDSAITLQAGQGRVDNAVLQVDKPIENSDLVDSELVTTAQQSQWLPMESAPKDESTPFLALVPVAGADKPVAIQVSNFQGDMYPDHLGNIVDFDDRVRTAVGWMSLPYPMIVVRKDEKNG